MAALLALGLAGSGCDRVRAWLALAGGAPAGPSSSLPAALGAYDCPPGLVRCAEGRVERSIGGSIDAFTLERQGCPFELLDTCAGRCVDDEDHLEEELPELCLGDADFRVRHPHAAPLEDAAAPGAQAEAAGVASDAARSSGGDGP